ncbi:MAG: SDR family oxidoreductase [Chloroflexi bacterium]|nr:SDR family oxidoreductase [Chloroflexota bacterium]
MDLKGKVAIVTGGGTGIGAATALALAGEGAAVALAGRRRQPLEEVAAQVSQHGGKALVVPCDVRRQEDTERLAQEALRALGRIDVLVNNAGRIGKHLAHGNGLEEWYDVAEWDDVIATDLRGPFLCIRAVLPTMVGQRSGIILNVLSTAVYSARAFPGWGAYAAAKLGMLGATRSLATAVHEYGIRVHALCPGNVDTAINRDLGKPPEALARMMRSEDIAEAARWLITRPDRVNIEEVAMMPRFEPAWRV